jgi:hypothetical protein
VAPQGEVEARGNGPAEEPAHRGDLPLVLEHVRLGAKDDVPRRHGDARRTPRHPQRLHLAGLRAQQSSEAGEQHEAVQQAAEEPQHLRQDRGGRDGHAERPEERADQAEHPERRDPDEGIAHE